MPNENSAVNDEEANKISGTPPRRGGGGGSKETDSDSGSDSGEASGSSSSSPLLADGGYNPDESVVRPAGVVFPIKLDLELLPVFGGLSLPPEQSLLVPDLDGSVMLLIQYLVLAGNLYFDATQWKELLLILNMDDFKSGAANERMEAFDKARKIYQRVTESNGDKPWETKEFRKAQQKLDLDLPRFGELLAIGFAEAAKKRNGDPAKEVVVIGDATCDRDASGGDILYYMLIRAAKEVGVTIHEMVSNHGLFSVGLKRALNNRFSTQQQPSQTTLSPELKQQLFEVLSRSFPKPVSDVLNEGTIYTVHQLLQPIANLDLADLPDSLAVTDKDIERLELLVRFNKGRFKAIHVYLATELAFSKKESPTAQEKDEHVKAQLKNLMTILQEVSHTGKKSVRELGKLYQELSRACQESPALPVDDKLNRLEKLKQQVLAILPDFIAEAKELRIATLDFCRDYNFYCEFKRQNSMTGDFESFQKQKQKQFQPLKDKLVLLLDWVRQANPNLFKHLLKKSPPSLKTSFDPPFALNRDMLLSELKKRSKAFNKSALFALFTYLSSVPENFLQDIDDLQSTLAQLDSQLAAASGSRRAAIRREQKKTKERLAGLGNLLGDLLSMLPVRFPLMDKVFNRNRDAATRCSTLVSTNLVNVEITPELTEENIQRFRAESIRTRQHLRLEMDHQGFVLQEVMSLANKPEVLSDISGMLNHMLTVTETLLRQASVLPKEGDYYYGSTARSWENWLPRFSLTDADLSFDSGTETIDGKTERVIFGATIKMGNEVEYFSNSSGKGDKRVSLRDPEKGHDSRSFELKMRKRFQDRLQKFDYQVLDQQCNPSPHVVRRVENQNRLMRPWVNGLSLVRRSGLKGDYIVHAPGVGLKGETPDQSMVNHVLRPIAKIMLDALRVREQDRTGDRGLIKKHIKALRLRLSNLASDLADNPVTHKNIWAMMDAANACFSFFVHNDWFIAEKTTQIPDGCIGLYSRSHNAAQWENIMHLAGRLPEGLPTDFGGASENNPLFNLVYPFAHLTWSRTDTAKPESMVYKDRRSGRVLCELQHNLGLFHGHTNGKGVDGKGLDGRWCAQQTQIEKRLVPVSNRPDLRMLGYDPSSELEEINRPRQETEFSFVSVETTETTMRRRSQTTIHLTALNQNQHLFASLLFKKLIRLANEEDFDNQQTDRTHSMSELAEVRVDRTNSGWVVTYKSLRELLKNCADEIMESLERRSAKSVVASLHDLLQAVSTHGKATDELKQLASWALLYLPDEVEAKNRANQAYSVRLTLLEDRRNGGKLKNAQLAEFMIPIFSFDPKSTALLRREMAGYFGPWSAYRKDIATYVDAKGFQDNHWRTLCEKQLQYPGTTKTLEMTTTPLQNVFAALAIVPNVWISLGMIKCSWSDFLSFTSNVQLGCFLGDWRTLLVTSMFFLVGYTLLKFNSKITKTKDKLYQQGPHKPGQLAPFLSCLTTSLSFLERFLPQFSGLAHQMVFSFFLRPFVYIELMSISEKMIGLVSDGILCPPESNATNSTSTTTTPFTSTPLDATTPTIGFETYFGNAESALYYPYFIPAALLGLAVSIFGLALSIKDPTTKVFPGHQSPSKVIDNFERSLSPVMRKAHSTWEGYNTWFDGNLFVGVGLYELLVVFGLSCSNQFAALAASCVMTVLFTLRMLAYPPRWVSSCYGNLSLKMGILGKQSSSYHSSLTDPELALQGNDRNLSEVLQHKVIPAFQKILTSAFTLPLFFYIQFIYYVFFVYQNFGTLDYIPIDLSYPESKGLWANAGVGLSLLSIDTWLVSGRDLTAVDDHDKAAKVYKSALKSTKHRQCRKHSIINTDGNSQKTKAVVEAHSGPLKGRS